MKLQRVGGFGEIAVQGFCDREIGDPAAMDIEPHPKVAIVLQRIETLIGELQPERQGRIVECIARCPRHRTRHVRNAVMDDAVDDVGRVVMRRRMRGLEAATLIDRDIDQNRGGFELGKLRARDKLRCARAGHQDCTDDDIGIADHPIDVGGGRVECLDPPRKDIIKFAQARQGAVDNGDLGAKTRCHTCRLGPDYSPAKNNHAGRRHAGNAAQQLALASCRLAQREGGSFDRKTSRDLAHRREQRQASACIGHRFVGNRGASGCNQTFRLLRIGSQMKIGEKHLSGSEP